MHVNLRGPFLCAKYALPALRERRGVIINIASVDGHWAEPGLAAYCASKGGLLALARAIAVDHGREGVRCTAICPSYVRTDMLEQFFDAQPRARPGARGRRRAARASTGSPTRTRSPRSRPGSPRTRRRSPPARRSSSTAASRPAGCPRA